MRNGTPGFEPQRLVQARLARGLTQSALAALLERSNSAISRWEKGLQSPEPRALDKLASQLNVPRDYFLKPAFAAGESPQFFRSMSSATLKARESISQRLHWLQELSTDLQTWVDFPPLDMPDFGIDDFLALRDEDIEAAAAQCRRHWQLGNGPIQDMLLVLENAGAVAAYDCFDTNSIDGLSNWCAADGRPYVLLAKDKQTAVRSRFDAAHELGHLVLHRQVALKSLRTSAEFNELERQANRFASAFLLPEDGFAAELSAYSLDAFLALKPRWRVSVAAMIYRCKDLERLSEETLGKLWRSRSARRWTKQEPYDDKWTPEQPRLLERTVRLLLTEGGFSTATLLAALRLPAYNLEMLAGLPIGFLSGHSAEIHHLPRPRLKNPPRRAPATGAKVLPFARRH